MRLLFQISIVFICSFNAVGQSNSNYLTKNGAWCWFSDPRAIIIDSFIFTGWVKANGTIEAARFDINTLDVQTSTLYHKLQKDDHNNPSFIISENGKLIAMYSKHNGYNVFINTLDNYKQEFKFNIAQRKNPVDRELLRQYRQKTVTYTNPITLAAENNKLYCFGRWTGFKPNIMWSTDEGSSWSKSKVFISKYPPKKRDRPYVKYYSDGISKIHIVFTDGHPRQESKNSVYYAFFQNEKFYNANGEVISDIKNIPFQPKEASIIYKPSELEGRAWIADISQDKQGNPIILYTKSLKQTNHEYWYVRYSDNGWEHHKICDSGKWFPQTKKRKKETEPYYFGNMTIHPDNSNVIYLSRQVNGIFEIERWETKDFGKTWSKESITKNSKYNNVRPFIPHGLKAHQEEVVLWMENQKYIHFTKYKTSIKYNIRKVNITHK